MKNLAKKHLPITTQSFTHNERKFIEDFRDSHEWHQLAQSNDLYHTFEELIHITGLSERKVLDLIESLISKGVVQREESLYCFTDKFVGEKVTEGALPYS